MIAAAQPALLVAAEPERHAAMGAELVHQPDAALGVAKGDEALTEQLDAHRRAIRPRQLLGQHGGDPIAAEELAHRRARIGAAERSEERRVGKECRARWSA